VITEGETRRPKAQQPTPHSASARCSGIKSGSQISKGDDIGSADQPARTSFTTLSAGARLEHVRGPCVDRGTLLVCPVVTLVNAGDPTTASADMIQDCFGNFEPHAKALQTRREPRPSTAPLRLIDSKMDTVIAASSRKWGPIWRNGARDNCERPAE
jgi:hypothetical protein